MMTDKKLWRNRKERKEWGRRLQSEDPGLEIVHPHAAGIDVGNGAHYVAVRPDRDPEPVRRFECFTADLHHLADWLQGCKVKTVAMQSTGVYWIPIYEILEERGFQVYLVNARHTKNPPGRRDWLPAPNDTAGFDLIFRARVRDHRQSTVGPQLMLRPKSMRCVQGSDDEGASNRA